MSKLLGVFFVLLSGTGFGFLGIFGRLAFQSGMSVGELLTFRFFTAAALLWIFILIFKAKLVVLPFKQILISTALGMCGYAVFSTFYFKAIEGISVPLAALLLFTFPIFVNLGSHFILKQRMKKIEVLSLILACIGLGVLLWGPLVINSFAAVLYGLGAGITYAIYVLVSGQLQKNVPPLSSSLYVITAAALALFAFHQPTVHSFIELSREQKLLIMGIAIISTIGPLTLFLAGLQRLSSAKASIIVMIEPVVATIAASFILNENLTGLQLTGSVLIIMAMVLNSLK